LLFFDTNFFKFFFIFFPSWYNNARVCYAWIFPFLLLFDTNKRPSLDSFLFLFHFHNLWLNIHCNFIIIFCRFFKPKNALYLYPYKMLVKQIYTIFVTTWLFENHIQMYDIIINIGMESIFRTKQYLLENIFYKLFVPIPSL